MTVLGGGRIVCFGEVLLRLSAPGAELLLQKPRLETAIGGAEANVAVSLAILGHDVRVVSALPDNPLGRAAGDELRRHGVDVSGVAFTGGRMGLYFLTHGAGQRAAEITYDRKHSAFAEWSMVGIDWARELQGASLLHVSGVTAALGPGAADGVVRAVKEARRLNVAVAFDCNYRAKLWQEWKGDAPRVLREIVAHADFLFGDHRDVSLILGKQTSPGRAAAQAAFQTFPDLKTIANTTRVQHSASQHELAAALYTRETEFAAPAMPLANIVDRIGAGDAFVAGLIHGLSKNKGDEHALRFALAAAVMKHSIPGDFNLAREADIDAVLAGELDVRR